MSRRNCLMVNSFLPRTILPLWGVWLCPTGVPAYTVLSAMCCWHLSSWGRLCWQDVRSWNRNWNTSNNICSTYIYCTYVYTISTTYVVSTISTGPMECRVFITPRASMGWRATFSVHFCQGSVYLPNFSVVSIRIKNKDTLLFFPAKYYLSYHQKNALMRAMIPSLIHYLDLYLWSEAAARNLSLMKPPELLTEVGQLNLLLLGLNNPPWKPDPPPTTSTPPQLIAPFIYVANICKKIKTIKAVKHTMLSLNRRCRYLEKPIVALFVQNHLHYQYSPYS